MLIGTPLFIIFNYIRNFLPNYKTKKNPSTPINNFIKENILNILKLTVWHQVIIQKT